MSFYSLTLGTKNEKSQVKSGLHKPKGYKLAIEELGEKSQKVMDFLQAHWIGCLIGLFSFLWLISKLNILVENRLLHKRIKLLQEYTMPPKERKGLVNLLNANLGPKENVDTLATIEQHNNLLRQKKMEIIKEINNLLSYQKNREDKRTEIICKISDIRGDMENEKFLVDSLLVRNKIYDKS
jgi:hypothetical protein